MPIFAPLCLRFAAIFEMVRGSYTKDVKDNPHLLNLGNPDRGRRDSGLNGRYWSSPSSSLSPPPPANRRSSSRVRQSSQRYSREDFIRPSPGSPASRAASRKVRIPALMASGSSSSSSSSKMGAGGQPPSASSSSSKTATLTDAVVRWMSREEKKAYLGKLRVLEAAQAKVAKPGHTVDDQKAVDRASKDVMAFKLDVGQRHSSAMAAAAAKEKKEKAAASAVAAASGAAGGGKPTAAGGAAKAAADAAAAKEKEDPAAAAALVAAAVAEADAEVGAQVATNEGSTPPDSSRDSRKDSMDVDKVDKKRSRSRSSGVKEDGRWEEIGANGKPLKKKTKGTDGINTDVVVISNVSSKSSSGATAAAGVAEGDKVFPRGTGTRTARAALTAEISGRLWPQPGQFESHQANTFSKANSKVDELFQLDQAGLLKQLWQKYKDVSDDAGFRVDLAQAAHAFRGGRKVKAADGKQSSDSKGSSPKVGTKDPKVKAGIGYAEKAKVGRTVVVSEYYLRFYMHDPSQQPNWVAIDEPLWKKALGRTYLELSKVISDFPTVKRGFSDYGYGYFICNDSDEMSLIRTAASKVVVDGKRFVALSREELSPSTVSVEVSSHGDAEVFEEMLEEVSKTILKDSKNGLVDLPDGSIVRDDTARTSCPNKEGGRNACITYKVNKQAWEVLTKRNKGVLQVYFEEWRVFWGTVRLAHMNDFPHMPQRKREADRGDKGAAEATGATGVASTSGSAAAAVTEVSTPIVGSKKQLSGDVAMSPDDSFPGLVPKVAGVVPLSQVEEEKDDDDMEIEQLEAAAAALRTPARKD